MIVNFVLIAVVNYKEWSNKMVVFNKLWQNIHDKIGSYQITISGEITISNKNNTQLLNLFDEERNKIYGYIDYIQKHFPYLSVGYNENLVEISIKIFSYNKYMNRKNFLDELRSVLVKIIYELNDGERFLGRLSITGTLVDRFQRSKFIMLSKHSIVEYKVVRQEAISGISSIVFNKILHRPSHSRHGQRDHLHPVRNRQGAL